MRVPRHLSGVLLAFVVAGCASGPRGDAVVRCEGCGFASALAQVIGAFADIDAQLAEARTEEAAGGPPLLSAVVPANLGPGPGVSVAGGFEMRLFLQEHAAHLAAWSQIALVLFALGGVAVLAVIALRWTRTRPGRRWLLVVGAGAALWFVVGAGVLLVMARGPMAPLVSTARNLQALVGRPFPEMAFRRVSDGAPMRLADFRGRTVLLDLWATWCPPCRAELPTLDRLHNAYADQGLVVVTLSDEPREQLAPVLAELTTATVNGAVESFGWLATMSNFRPFCVVIDRDGVLRDYAFGVTDYEVFERKVRKVLAR